MRLFGKILLIVGLLGAGYVVRAWIRYESSIPAPALPTAAAVPVPMPTPARVPEAPRVEPPPPPLPATLSLAIGEGLTLELSGRLPPGEAAGRLRQRVAEAVPKLFEIHDTISIDPAAPVPDWLPDLPDFAAELVGSVQDPVLEIGEGGARVGGKSDDREALGELRDRFESLFASAPSRAVALDYDAAKPAPETRMPLVLYLGPEEGRYLVAASVPTAALREALADSVEKAVGEERFTDRIRVSPDTVEEPWMDALPTLLGSLLGEKNGAMELIIVDRGVELKGELPDEAAREALLELLAPAREAGYGVRDELRVKGGS